MLVHRGLALCTREHYLRIAGRFLTWQWRLTATDWRRVRPEHIRRFAERCARGYRPKTVGDELSALRQFLRFMHLRGLISPWLPQAVPRVADYGHGRRKEVLTDAQRRQFLAGFERRLPKRRRDYAMALCMLDLGLRGVEICRLRLCDIDWSRQPHDGAARKEKSGTATSDSTARHAGPACLREIPARVPPRRALRR